MERLEKHKFFRVWILIVVCKCMFVSVLLMLQSNLSVISQSTSSKDIDSNVFISDFVSALIAYTFQ